MNIKNHIELLKDATNFDVEHFIANDLIGFNIEAENLEKMEEFDNRLKASYASLPKIPNLFHKGKIM